MIAYVIVSLVNVFLHIFRSILVIKAGKLLASTANCITYTFSAVVVKYISENSLLTAVVVAAATNFLGCWLAMSVYEKLVKRKNIKECLE